MSVCWCNISKSFSASLAASRRSAPSRSPFPRHLSVPALRRPFLPPELSVAAVLLYQGEPSRVRLLSAPLPASPRLHSITPYRANNFVDVTRRCIDLFCALVRTTAFGICTYPHERRSVATTQNTLPWSHLRLHLAARNSSQQSASPADLRSYAHCLRARPARLCILTVVAENATQPTAVNLTMHESS